VYLSPYAIVISPILRSRIVLVDQYISGLTTGNQGWPRMMSNLFSFAIIASKRMSRVPIVSTIFRSRMRGVVVLPSANLIRYFFPNNRRNVMLPYPLSLAKNFRSARVNQNTASMSA
jgi:hypothetical protein